jgi:hypothetical protein
MVMTILTQMQLSYLGGKVAIGGAKYLKDKNGPPGEFAMCEADF